MTTMVGALTIAACLPHADFDARARALVSQMPLVELCDAVLLAWYPGPEGGRAVPPAVFGDANPSGRLPVSFPVSYDDLPPVTAGYATSRA